MTAILLATLVVVDTVAIRHIIVIVVGGGRARSDMMCDVNLLTTTVTLCILSVT